MNIIIPRQKIILPRRVAVMRGEVAGYISVEKAKCDSEGNELPGTRHLVVPQFKNVITNVGLDAKGDTILGLDCLVGTSNTPIVDTTVQLGNGIAKFNSKVGDVQYIRGPVGVDVSTAYPFGWKRGTYRFSAGNGTGNLTEVGLAIGGYSGGATTPTSPIFCGSLFKDGLGNPIVVPKQADELLDVTYELRLYAKTTDDTYFLDIDGTTYTFTTRAIMNGANAPSYWGQIIVQPRPGQGYGAGAGGYGTVFWMARLARGTTLANLGLIPDDMGGTTIQSYTGNPVPSSVTVSYDTYVPGSYSRECTVLFDGSTGNHADGISGIIMPSGVGQYKTQITPALPKILGTNLEMKYRWYWARYTGPG